MWDLAINSNIIQIELGDKVISAYSSSKRQDCDVLRNQIGELRSRLAEEHIDLPIIALRYSDTLPADMFSIYFGALCINGSYKTDHIPQILANQARIYHLEDCSYDGLMQNFQSGVNYLQARNYQKAIYDFAQSYYCSSFRNDTRSIMVNSMINICGIQFLNQQYDSALSSGLRACVLAISDSFYDPYLKYYAASWTGIVYLQLNNLEQAIRHFELAYGVVAQTSESCLSISALSTLVHLYMKAGAYSKSAEGIDAILDILQNDGTLDIDKDFLIQLARFQSQVNKAMVSQLTSEYEQLQAKYAKLSARFLPQLTSFALNVLYKHGFSLLSCAIGSFLGGDKYMQFGNENIMAKENTVMITANS